MKKIQRIAAAFKKANDLATALYNEAFELAESKPGSAENEAAEAAWSAAEDAANAIRQQLADEIQRMTSGMIDNRTAWSMTFKHELFDLIAKLA